MGRFNGTHVLVEVDDLYRYAHLQKRWLSLYGISDGKAKEDFNFAQDPETRDWVDRHYDHDHTRQLERNLSHLKGLKIIITPTKGGVLNTNEEQTLQYSGLPQDSIDLLKSSGVMVGAVNIPNLERLLQEEFLSIN